MIFKCNLEIMIAKILNIDGLYGLFHFIFVPIHFVGKSENC